MTEKEKAEFNAMLRIAEVLAEFDDEPTIRRICNWAASKVSAEVFEERLKEAASLRAVPLTARN